MSTFPFDTIEPNEDRQTRVLAAGITLHRHGSDIVIPVNDFYVSYRDEIVCSTDPDGIGAEGADGDLIYTFIVDDLDRIQSDQYTQSDIIRSAIELRLTDLSDRLSGQLGGTTDVAAAFKSVSDRLNP
jgi:hypothetical protein